MPRQKLPSVPSVARDLVETWARARPDLPPDCVYVTLIMRLGRTLLQRDNKHVRQIFGLNNADLRVLFSLRRIGPPYRRRPAEMARTIQITGGAVTKQVDRLSDLGLVQRHPDPESDGGSYVQLTPKGVKLADDGMNELTKTSILSDSRSSLTKAERDTLGELCLRVLIDLEHQLEAEEKAAAALPRKGIVKTLPRVRTSAK